jgi:hypothetical protein
MVTERARSAALRHLLALEGDMTRLLYDIEDYLEDAAQAAPLPWWMRRIVHSISRTAGETADLLFRRHGGF